MAHKHHLKLDFRVLCAALLLIILLMLAMWRPWQQKSDTSRRITIAGSATISAEPDFFSFNPSYQSSNPDREIAQAEVNDKVNSVIAKLKDMGVDESDIQLNANSYEQYYARPADGQAVTAHISVHVRNKELAQKVQDYLLTTAPTGSITPRPGFSDEKRKQLENEARDKAIADARQQAERTAKQLNAKLGEVIEVKDHGSGSGIMPMEMRADSGSSSDSNSSLPVMPGQQDISITVEAIFEIR